MYSDMYETFDDVPLKYNYPISFERRNKPYLQMNKIPDIIWNYGDSINLHFSLKGVDYMGKSFVVTFYNFRFEEVYSQELTPNEGLDEVELTVHIDSQLSEKEFDRGIYYCGIRMVDNSASIYDITTILSSENYYIHVV